jgi:tetratricopeptide (TPR) repeat protein
MDYYTTTIDVIAEKLRKNREHGYKTAVLIGAGVSATGGIPVASGIIDRIKTDFSEICAKCNCSSYADYMNAISPLERKRVIKQYIDNSRLNAATLYMATLVRDDYVDRILTTNFDSLASKALALENIFPGIYDFAASQHFVSGEAANISIFHLHGQIDGFVILNTVKEVEKHYNKLKPVFDDSFVKRTIIVVGYSGLNDPVLKHLDRIRQFNNDLYWVGFLDHEPADHIRHMFENERKRAFYLKGYDADTFFIELARKLGSENPRIISRPFSYLEELTEHIAMFRFRNTSFDPVKEVKKWIIEAREHYEDGHQSNLKQNTRLYKEGLIKFAREAYMNSSRQEYEKLSSLVGADSPDEAKNYYAMYLTDWGINIRVEADDAEWAKKETLIMEAIDKFRQAALVYPKGFFSWNEWGAALKSIGELKPRIDSEKYYRDAIEKFKKAIELNSDEDAPWNNCAITLITLSRLKPETEAVSLIREAIEMYKHALRINPDEISYNNLALAYANLGSIVDKKEAASIYNAALKNFAKALELNPENSNPLVGIGVTYANLARLKNHQEQIKLNNDAIEKFRQALEINPGNYNASLCWAIAMDNIGRLNSGIEAEKKFTSAIEKFNSLCRKQPGNYITWNGLGRTYSHLALLKQGKDATGLFRKAINSISKANEIKHGEGLYNLACVYALKKEPQKAIECLLDAFDAYALPRKRQIIEEQDLRSIIADEKVQDLLRRI